MPRVLVVDDTASIRFLIRTNLELAGFDVDEAVDGVDCLEFLSRAEVLPDAITVDVMMPRLDGFAVCAELRRLGQTTPVLMLTAKGQVRDRVNGLDVGADDYLVKPFSTDELLARVRALLRRVQRPDSVVRQLSLGDVQIDFIRQRVTRKRKELHFTAKEFAMLKLLAEAGGETVSRERFLDNVWGYAAFPTTRTVDMHIASLRRKLEKNPDEPRWINAVHGVGYRLEVER